SAVWSVRCRDPLLVYHAIPRDLHSFPTRRSSDLLTRMSIGRPSPTSWSTKAETESSEDRSSGRVVTFAPGTSLRMRSAAFSPLRSEEHTSELQSRENLVCRLLLEKKKKREKQSYT